jgi:CheY-like chemotaxis protein
VLDLAMPGQSGLDVLTAIKGDPGLAATPVVIFTASARLGDREQAEATGVDRFLEKPFSPLELIRVVDELLRPAG